jgi:hypothetical protein
MQGKSSVSSAHDGILVVGAPEKAMSDAALLRHMRIVHFCKGNPQSEFDDGALHAPMDEMRVRETSLAWFLRDGTAPEIVDNLTRTPAFPPDVIVQRARSFLGAKRYNVSTYCVYGNALSEAVQRVGLYIGGALVTVGLCVVLATRELVRTPW